MADGKITISTELKTEEVKKQAQNLKKTCEDLLGAIDKEAERTGGKLSAGVRTIKTYLQDLIKEVDVAQKELEEIQKGPDVGDKAEKIEEKTKALESLNNEMREYQEHLKEVATAEIEREEGKKPELPSVEAVDAAIKKMSESVHKGLSGTKGDMTSFVAAFNTQFVGGMLRGTGVVSSGIANALARLNAALMGTPIGAILLAITAALTALIAVVKKASKVVDQIIPIIKNGLKKALKECLDVVSALTKGFFSLGAAVSGTVLNGIRLLLNRILSLKGTVMEYLNYMAKWHGGNNALNKSLSNLSSSLNYIKGALASAFAPIVIYIEPWLTSLMDKIAELITLFGMMIAKLTGAKSFQKVIRQQKDYAKSLDATNEKLAEYDKLQVVNQDNGAGGVGWDFEEIEDIPIPDWLKDLSDLFTNVGKTIRDFLNGIPWSKIQESTKRIASWIAYSINQLLGVEGLGSSIGHTLAQLSNTFLTFINTLLTRIRFDQLGKQLGEAFTTILDEFKFDELGDMFSNALNALADLIINFFKEISGTDLGEAISTFLQHAFGNLNWDKIKEAVHLMVEDLVQLLNSLLTPENFVLVAQTLAELLNTLFQAIGDFAKGSKWKEWGVAIGEGINKLFEDFKASDAGQAISDLAIGLLDMILSAVDEINWDDVSNKLVDFLSSIDWEAIGDKATEISDKLSEGLEKVWNALKESGVLDRIIDMIVDFLNIKDNWEKLFARVKWDMIKGIAKRYISQFMSDLWEDIKEKFKENFHPLGLAKSFFDDAVEAFNEQDWLRVGTDIIEGLVAPFRAPWNFVMAPFQALFDAIFGGLLEKFGIHSPAETMLPVGENIVLGILEGFGLVDFVGKIQEWWNTNVAPWFTFQRWAELGDNMKRAMSEKVDSMKTSLVTKFTSLKTSLSTIFDNIKTKFIDVWKNIKEGIRNPINSILSGIETFINAVINGLNRMITAVNGLHFDLPDWVPLVGGKSLGFTIPQLSTVTIPRLAQGAVIPPNKQFAAILGDQKSGTNIETPLDTMVQAFKQALAETGGTHDPVILQLNGRTVAQAVWDEERKRYKQTGMAY